MNKNALNNSIIIVGPVGAGKSLISQELSRKTGLPIITTDSLRFCPNTIEEIEAMKRGFYGEMCSLKKRLEICVDKKEREELEKRLSILRNRDAICDIQIKMRRLLPNVPNYDNMGYNSDVSNFVRRYGDVAWHFYEKQFENTLLCAILEQLDTPAIVDMGGVMAISLDDEYAVFAEQARAQNPEWFNKYMDMDKVGFDIIKSQLSKCPCVVELVLPQDYKATMEKAGGNATLNDKFINSGQFSQVSNYHISVEGLLNGRMYNPNKLAQIVKEIENINVKIK